ncbi:hypothetical protein ACS0TY_015058 [Phlomoides rotata]
MAEQWPRCGSTIYVDALISRSHFLRPLRPKKIEIRKIVKDVPTRRQTLMYTATWPKEVRRIAADLLVNPVQVNIGNVDELVANKAITQAQSRIILIFYIYIA